MEHFSMNASQNAVSHLKIGQSQRKPVCIGHQNRLGQNNRLDWSQKSLNQLNQLKRTKLKTMKESMANLNNDEMNFIDN